MPSQEDYLDNLLKDLTESNEQDESLFGQDEEEIEPDAGISALDAEVPDLDAVSEMSEDEINRLLSAGADQEDELSSASDMDLSDEDVLKMLEESDDEELQDIQDLLQKSDNNEAVDDSITAMLEDYPEEDLETKILGGGDDYSDGGDNKEPKKDARNEKKELARLKKEKQREEAAARKADKKAAKAAQKEKSKRGQKAEKREEEQSEEQREDGMQGDLADQDLFDPSVLDSIVSEADLAGQRQEPPEEDATSEPDMIEAAEEQVPEVVGIDGGELDLDSLFGDDGDADLLADMGDGEEVLSKTEDSKSLEGGDNPKEKQGFFARIMNFLTEEDEEENENIKLSRENKDILDDLDKEEKGAKGKKGKKGKEKDDKKIKEKPKKEPKPKKAPKPKKERPVKEAPSVPGKKLSMKKVLPVVLVGVSVGVLVFVFVNSVTDYSDKKTAKTAYYEGDYQTCYQNLFGKDLNETESIMFGKSESILYIRLWIREFEMYMAEGDRVRALDSLIQTIDSYPDLYSYAGQWNAEEDIAAGYAIILNYLSGEFGLTEGQAQTIAAVRSDREYTKMVTAIAGGRTFENWDAPAASEVPKQDPAASEQDPTVSEPEENQIPDMLPEEDGLGNDTFIDNQ